jgi:hypothetical protein
MSAEERAERANCYRCGKTFEAPLAAPAAAAPVGLTDVPPDKEKCFKFRRFRQYS